MAGSAAAQARWHHVSAEDALAHGILGQRSASFAVADAAREAPALEDAPARTEPRPPRLFRGVRYGLLLSCALWAGLVAAFKFLA
jgi:hypothetical protein